jgi:glycosyltransferase involved in cell wall biosynthesis
MPVHNQADHIAAVVEDVDQQLSQLDDSYELLLVVNGCRDESAAVCRQSAATRPWVRVLESERGGWGSAVRLGLSQARGDWLCYTNSARTPGSVLLQLLQCARAHPESIVQACRQRRGGYYRRLGSFLFNAECRALLGLTSHDVNGTPKMFPRKFARLLSLVRGDDLLDAEFHLVARRQGYPILEVPVTSRARRGGRSTTSMRTAAQLFWGVFRLWLARRNPA